MAKMWRVLSVMVVMTTWTAMVWANGQTVPYINLSGSVVDSGDQPVTGTVPWQVLFYDDAVGGATLGSDSGSVTFTTQGVYNLVVWATSGVLEVDNVYYQLAIDTDDDGLDGDDVFGDRVAVHSVPFTKVAADARLLDGQAGSHYTNASNLAAGTVPSARLNLVDSDVPNDLTIIGGDIDNTVIGSATRAAGNFTTLTATMLTATGVSVDAVTAEGLTSSTLHVRQALPGGDDTYLKVVSGKVGINYATPVEALEVVGSASVSGSVRAATFYGDGSNLTGIGGGGGGGIDTFVVEIGNTGISSRQYLEWVAPADGSVIGVYAYCNSYSPGTGAYIDVQNANNFDASVLSSLPQFTSGASTAGTLKTNGHEDFSAGDSLKVYTSGDGSVGYARTIIMVQFD